MDRADRSVLVVGRARRLATVLAGRITTAAGALDAADARCAVGDRRGARSVRRATSTDAAAAVSALPQAVDRYGAALDAVPQTSPYLTASVRAARTEVSALRRFAAVAAHVWPAYARLDHQEATWVTRAFVPWYRTPRESADAYAVMVGPTRAKLDAARTALATATAALLRAEDAAVRAFDAYDRTPASPA